MPVTHPPTDPPLESRTPDPLAPEPLATLGRQVRRAVIWRSGSQIAAQLIAWAATFLVIRILGPADYGLFAMTQVVLVLLNILNGQGLANAAIREAEVTPRQVRQLFGMLLAMNGILAAAQFLCAPLAAAYYRHPEVADLMRVQALLYLATPHLVLGTAILSRTMDFRAQGKANVASAVAGALTALTGALAGLGVWTLVFAPMALFWVRALVLARAARLWIRPSFDFRGAGGFARYGGLMTMSAGFAFAASQSDVLIAGRLIGAYELGLYTTALFLTQIFVGKFVPPLNEVAFSAYARLQHEPRLVGRAFLRLVATVMAAGIPFCLGLAVTAEPLVATVLGPQWIAAAPVVRLLALAMPAYILLQLVGPAGDSLGRPDLSTATLAGAALLLPPAFLAGIHLWGVRGLAAAWLVAYPLLLAWSLRRTLPLLQVRAGELARTVAPALLAGIAMAAAVRLAARATATLPPLAQLPVLVAVGGAVYLGWLLVFSRASLAELVNAARGRF